MNGIITKQNSPEMIRLMRGRRAAYANAEVWQQLQIAVVVALPALGAAVGLALPEIRPWVAAIALVATLLDVWFLDPMQKTAIKLAARISEIFDCHVLELPWNEFVVGSKPDPELIETKCAAFKGDEEKLRGWYKPIEIANAPLPLARIICQRENLWYNAGLRRRAGEVLAAIAAFVAVTACILGMVNDLSIAEFVVFLAAPSSPVIFWALRERVRQRDAADALEHVKAAADRFWKVASSEGCPDAESAARSREFQDAIYLRRALSALPLPVIYRVLRPTMERTMKVGAADHLRQIGVTVSLI
ncbi:S-4TM family putative pore-forming effector [Sphingomonas sp. ZB1N12]|uniref:S-4TM family putative pore-forming effector n=1 Tax=Sphingomonas arabinosi TaxID=3096160 RepID=UPI002FCB479A